MLKKKRDLESSDAYASRRIGGKLRETFCSIFCYLKTLDPASYFYIIRSSYKHQRFHIIYAILF
jgi:hypothetical protein